MKKVLLKYEIVYVYCYIFLFLFPFVPYEDESNKIKLHPVLWGCKAYMMLINDHI